MLEELWAWAKPATIALLAIASRLCVAPPQVLTPGLIARKLFVSISLAYFIIYLAPLYTEDPKLQFGMVALAAFFADDIIFLAVSLGKNLREDGPKYLLNLIKIKKDK